MVRERNRMGEAREEEALGMIGAWAHDHPDFFLTFSGGKDSTVLLHLLQRVIPKPRIAFFDTGLTFTQTRKFIVQIAKAWDVEVIGIKTSPSPVEVLKEAGAYSLQQKHEVDFARIVIDNYLNAARKHFDTIYSMYGMRASESKVRTMLLGKTRGYTQQHDSRGNLIGASVAPLWNWQDRDVNDYILAHRIPMNPVYKRMRELGIPVHKRRTGLALGSKLHLGGWAETYAIDPVLAKRLEADFPLLRSFR